MTKPLKNLASVSLMLEIGRAQKLSDNYFVAESSESRWFGTRSSILQCQCYLWPQSIEPLQLLLQFAAEVSSVEGDSGPEEIHRAQLAGLMAAHV